MEWIDDMATLAPSTMTSGAHDNRAFLNSAIRLALFLFAISFVSGTHFTIFQLKDQDRPVLIGMALLLGVVHFAPPLRLRPLSLGWPSTRGLLALLGGVAMVLWALTNALMGDFGVSYDEYMVLFDGEVYRSGQLAAPLAAEWREYARNLVTAFLLNEVQPQGMISAYLPMNAILRMLFSQALPAALMNPVLFMIGGVALLDIARRQFGDDRETILVVFLLYSPNLSFSSFFFLCYVHPLRSTLFPYTTLFRSSKKSISELWKKYWKIAVAFLCGYLIACSHYAPQCY